MRTLKLLLAVMIIGAITLSCENSPVAETEEPMEMAEDALATRAESGSSGYCSGCGFYVTFPCTVCSSDPSRCALHKVKNCGFCSTGDGVNLTGKNPRDRIQTWPVFTFDPKLVVEYTFCIKFWYHDAPIFSAPYFSGDIMYFNEIEVDSNLSGGYYYLYIYYEFPWTLTRGTFPAGVSFASVDDNTGALDYTTTSFIAKKWHTFLLKVNDNSTGNKRFSVKLSSYHVNLQENIVFYLNFLNPQNLFGRIFEDPDPTDPIGGPDPVDTGRFDPGNP